ncbi:MULTISPECIES: hypothetical protein [Bradyrhizobium]|uniref:Uncharacterized protein n=1 Tax=Bradyrhizobium ottawaense TaxID=931866 RepID=A0A2U8PFY0_9BRAD|nr:MULTISPECIES: hypothetical protein [Bradyrhizobium]AWL96394.1 hypothetical protein CIT37_32915 [Bradyrhizobium ottawaense]MBR1288273.1 hypothetical protein [Bradyrhizobium ottawaense]MBR1328194.1 hypothetical protein [Bradyrhizobium ottawaense]MBR1334037.1 hypothetical protein [Bradyrhizobium ottawaense]MDA9420264.1 hypothetical protein [Bradyrhizobium sp. CCBAU 25360]
MLATLNPKQIVDEIVKDTVKDNDPHDAIQISPDIVLASRPISVAPALAPDIATRPEPKFAPEPKALLERKISIEPKFSPVSEPQAAPPPSVDTAVRVAASDGLGPRKRSPAGKWLRGAFVTFLFAGGSAAATIAWEKHGDTAKQMFAEWTPALTSLLPSTSQTAPVAAAQAAPPVEQAAPPAPQAATDQTADQSATPPAVQVAAAAPAATQSDAAQSVQAMTRDLTAMAQQIETLKANIAELKAGQEQMAREMAKPPAPKPVAEVKPVDPRTRAAAVPPRAPSPPPVRKPKPVVSHTYMPAYSPAPLAASPPPSQAAAMPPPPAAPVTTTQAVADDDGPVVRPPMPLR